MANLVRILRHARPYRRLIGIAVAAAVIVSVLATVQPILVRAVVDRGIIGRDPAALTKLIVVLLVCGVVQAALFSTRRQLVGWAASGIQQDVRQRYFERVQTQDRAFHERVSPGQLLSRGSSDLNMAGEFLMMLPFMLTLFLQVVLAVVAMFLLDARLAAVATALVPLLLVAGRMFSTRFDPVVWKLQQRVAEFATLVEQTVTGIRVVKAFGRERHQSDRAAQHASGIHDAAFDAVRLQARYMPFFGLVPQLAIVALLWFGGRRVLGGDITLGTLVAFNTYVGFLTWPLQELGGLFASAQRASTAAGRVFEILDEEPAIADRAGARPLESPQGHVRLEAVKVGYDGRAVLDGVDLDVPAGTSLAVVGPTGCGKSTLLALIARFVDPDAGRVLLDGVDVASVTLDSVRRTVGYVFEDTFLFSDTIESNIAFGASAASHHDVVRAATLAQADAFVRDLPRGYATKTGEHGYSLSGGQRQRVALARAVLVNPRVLLLDDATSSVDARVEAAIRRGLAEAMRGRTTILVARRPSSAALADRVAFMDHGLVVALGTHADLWASSQEYRDVLGGGDGAEHVQRYAAADAELRQAEPAPTPPQEPEDDAQDLPADDAARHVGRRELAVLGPLLRPELPRAVAAVSLLVVSQLAALATPFLLRYAIDRGIARGSAGPLDRAALVMLVAALSVFVCMRASMVLAGRAGQGVLRRLREGVFDHLTRLDLAFFERTRTGALVSRLTADVEVIERLLTEGLAYAGSLTVYLAGAVIVLIVLDPLLAAASLAFMVPLVTFATIWFRTRSERNYARVREATAQVLNSMQETIRGAQIVQAFARERRNAEEFAERNVAWRRASVGSYRLAGVYFPLIEISRLGATVIVLWVGGRQVFAGRLTVGALAAFLVALQSTAEPLFALSQLYDTFQGAMAGLSRLAGVLEEQPTVVDGTATATLEDAHGDARLDSAEFRYTKDAPLVLKTVDLQAPAGTVLALVGETGAGKSTIAKLLLRFYDPSSGTVRLDGHDLRDLPLDALRMHTALVPQEGFLFGGTVGDNVRFGRPCMTDDEIRDLCRAIGVADVLEALPQGYDTDVASLSGGERQLIALARAIAADPTVLVLDEATSALDPGTESRVQRALQHAFSGRTTILIAHRLSTVMRADMIVVVHKGRIAETGTHEELAAKPEGLYASLFTHWLVSA